MIHTINTTFREAKTTNSTTQKTYSLFIWPPSASITASRRLIQSSTLPVETKIFRSSCQFLLKNVDFWWKNAKKTKETNSKWIQLKKQQNSKNPEFFPDTHVFQNYKKGKKVCATNQISLKMLKYASKRHRNTRKILKSLFRE